MVDLAALRPAARAALAETSQPPTGPLGLVPCVPEMSAADRKAFVLQGVDYVNKGAFSGPSCFTATEAEDIAKQLEIAAATIRGRR